MSNMDLVVKVLESIVKEENPSITDSYLLAKIVQATSSEGVSLSGQEVLDMMASIKEVCSTMDFPSNGLSPNPGLVKGKEEVNQGANMDLLNQVFCYFMVVNYEGVEARNKQVEELTEFMSTLPPVLNISENFVAIADEACPGLFLRMLYYSNVEFGVFMEDANGELAKFSEQVQLDFDPNAPEGAGNCLDIPNLDIPKDVPYLTISNVGEWMAFNLLNFFEKLETEELVKLLGLVIEGATINGKAISLEAFQDEWYTFDFSDGGVQARNVHYFIRKVVEINDRRVEGRDILALMMLSLMSQYSAGDLNNYMNILPNLWQSDPMYGAQALDKFKADSFITPAKLNLTETEMPVAVVTSYSGLWFDLENTKFNPESLKTALSSGKAVITDKNAAKRLGVGVVAETAGIGRSKVKVRNADTKEMVEVDALIIANDVSKPSKLLNRPGQSYYFLCANQPGWEWAKFGIMASDGQVYRQGGRHARLLYCLSTLSAGSGPAYTRPGYTVPYRVRKSSDAGRVDFLGLPSEVRDALNSQGKALGYTKDPGINHLKHLIEEAAEAVIGCKFEYGEEMLGLDIPLLDGSTYHLSVLRNRKINQTIELVGKPIIRGGRQTLAGEIVGEWFTVKFAVDLVAEDPIVKARLAFFKMVFRPGENLTFLDEEGNDIGWGSGDQQVDIISTAETGKANNFKYVFFAEAMGGGHLEINQMRLVLDHPQNCHYLSEEEIEQGYIDLSPEVEAVFDEDGKVVKFINPVPRDNAVTRWLKDAVHTRTVCLKMAYSEYEYWAEVNKDFISENPDLIKIEKGSHYVTVTEKCECILGDVYYEVEIASPRESGGRTGMTVQEVCALSIVSPKLADAIMAESEEHQKSIVQLVNMLNGTLEGVEKSVTLTSRKTVEGLSAAIAKKLGTEVGSLAGLNDSEVIDLMYQLKPQGIKLVADKGEGKQIVLHVDFKALRSTNVFVNGYCDEGPVKSLIATLKFAVESVKEGENFSIALIYSRLALAKTAMKTWLEGQLESKALFKRASQSAKVRVSGKITTGLDPYLDNQKGLPVVYLHPDDMRVVELFKKANGEIIPEYARTLSNGKQVLDWNKINNSDIIVMSGRTPMVMVGFFLLRLSSEHGYVGYTNMGAHFWTMINHGDGDGDGDTLLNASQYGMTIEEAIKANRNLLSIKGYTLLFGDNPAKHPYADFCLAKEAKFKKSFLKDSNLVYFWYFTPEQYFEVVMNVHNHYKSAVGISYGIASVLTFELTELAYQLGDMKEENGTYKLKKYATLVAWGILYEGLGLSGWSAKAALFFECLRLRFKPLVGFDKEGKLTAEKQFWVGEQDGFNPCGKMVEILKGEFTPSGEEVKNVDKFFNGVLRLLIDAEETRLAFGAIAKGRASVKGMDAARVAKAALAGCLREGSRGTDVGGELQYEENNAYEEVPARSIHSIVQDAKLWETLDSPLLSGMVERLSSLHVKASKFKALVNQREIMGG